jgi:O-antigen ligase
LLVTQAQGSESRSIPVAVAPTGSTFSTNPDTANVILNGRVSAWKAAVGDQPLQWIFGRGVGTVGTAARRAGYTFVPSADSGTPAATTAVDSGYLATVADVGIVGLLVLLMLLGRLCLLAVRAIRVGIGAGWLALGVLVTLLLDALTRASFTGFPTAFLALLFIGIALAAAREEEETRPPVSPRARGRARRGPVPLRPARIA